MNQKPYAQLMEIDDGILRDRRELAAKDEAAQVGDFGYLVGGRPAGRFDGMDRLAAKSVSEAQIVTRSGANSYMLGGVPAAPKSTPAEGQSEPAVQVRSDFVVSAMASAGGAGSVDGERVGAAS